MSVVCWVMFACFDSFAGFISLHVISCHDAIFKGEAVVVMADHRAEMSSPPSVDYGDERGRCAFSPPLRDPPSQQPPW